MIKAIYDTDPGVDDAVALHFAAENPAITLVGITTVFGNNTLDVTTRNALFLKEKLDIDCPVARGAATPPIPRRWWRTAMTVWGTCSISHRGVN